MATIEGLVPVARPALSDRSISSFGHQGGSMRIAAGSLTQNPPLATVEASAPAAAPRSLPSPVQPGHTCWPPGRRFQLRHHSMLGLCRAYSHSTSVGSRPPTASHSVFASCQRSSGAGRLPRPAGASPPCRAANFPYAAKGSRESRKQIIRFLPLKAWPTSLEMCGVAMACSVKISSSTGTE